MWSINDIYNYRRIQWAAFFVLFIYIDCVHVLNRAIVHDDRRNLTIKLLFFLNEYRQVDVMRKGRMH